jgi:hypothetical protein
VTFSMGNPVAEKITGKDAVIYNEIFPETIPPETSKCVKPQSRKGVHLKGWV